MYAIQWWRQHTRCCLWQSGMRSPTLRVAVCFFCFLYGFLMTPSKFLQRTGQKRGVAEGSALHWLTLTSPQWLAYQISQYSWPRPFSQGSLDSVINNEGVLPAAQEQSRYRRFPVCPPPHWPHHHPIILLIKLLLNQNWQFSLIIKDYSNCNSNLFI